MPRITQFAAQRRAERLLPLAAEVAFTAMLHVSRVRTKHAELALEDIAAALPGTGEIMASTSSCYAMCWHAADGGNWDLAAYYLRRTRSLLRGLAVTRPKYADQLRAYDEGILERLYEATLAGDRDDFERLYQAATDAANAYHVETGHPYIRWTRPAQPPERGLDLTDGP
jgi:hypothetical protein